MSGLNIIIIAVVIIAGYQIISVRLSRSVQPLRLEVAEIGEELLAADDMPGSEKRRLESLISWVFSSGVAWLVVFATIWVFFRGIFRRHRRSPSDVPAHHRDAVDRINRLGLVCVIANSPLALIVFLLIGLVGTMFAPIDRLVRNGVSALTAAMDGKARIVRH